MRSLMRTAVCLAAVLFLAGCSGTRTAPNWDANIQNSPTPGLAKQPNDSALACVASHAPDPELVPKIGIGTIGNSTGIFDYEGAGNYLPVDAAHMFTTALKDAGFRVVLREGSTTKMVEWELNYAMQKVLGDGKINTVMDISQGKEGREIEIPYRVVGAGTLLGSDLLLVGSINRLDFDTTSGGLEIFINGYELGRRSYSALVGMDLALIDTRTTEVIWAETYSKEYFGIENKAGVFKVEGKSNIVDVNFGIQSNDPLHAGLMDMVGFASYDMARTIFHAGTFCDTEMDRNRAWEDKDTMRRPEAGKKYSKK